MIKAYQEYLDLLGARAIKDFLVYLDSKDHLDKKEIAD